MCDGDYVMISTCRAPPAGGWALTACAWDYWPGVLQRWQEAFKDKPIMQEKRRLLSVSVGHGACSAASWQPLWHDSLWASAPWFIYTMTSWLRQDDACDGYSCKLPDGWPNLTTREYTWIMTTDGHGPCLPTCICPSTYMWYTPAEVCLTDLAWDYPGV